MFESSQTDYWESLRNKDGAHYNTYRINTDCDSMAALKNVFKHDGSGVNELNFILFSTAGVHGTYAIIEEEEKLFIEGPTEEMKSYSDYDGSGKYRPDITFVIIQPRLVCMRYGTVEPKSLEDFEYLKKIRQLSWDAMLTIGREDGDEATDPLCPICGESLASSHGKVCRVHC